MGAGPRPRPRPLPRRGRGEGTGELGVAGGEECGGARAQASSTPEGEGGYSLLRAPGVGSGPRSRPQKCSLPPSPSSAARSPFPLPVTSALELSQGTFWKAKAGGSFVPAPPRGVGAGPCAGAPVGVGPVPECAETSGGRWLLQTAGAPKF